MRKILKQSGFKMWRTRTNGRVTEHEKLRSGDVSLLSASGKGPLPLIKSTGINCSKREPVSLKYISRYASLIFALNF